MICWKPQIPPVFAERPDGRTSKEKSWYHKPGCGCNIDGFMMIAEQNRRHVQSAARCCQLTVIVLALAAGFCSVDDHLVAHNMAKSGASGLVLTIDQTSKGLDII